MIQIEKIFTKDIVEGSKKIKAFDNFISNNEVKIEHID